MAEKPHKSPTKTRVNLDTDALPGGGGEDTFEALEEASKRGSFLGKVGSRFQEVLHSSRGNGRNAVLEAGEDPSVTADDLAISRAKSVRAQRMVVPEGVIIEGAMTSGSETEIAGRIDGDVTVDGWLHLNTSALVSGSVRATSCKVDGLVDGRVECAHELDLGSSGRLNADALAARKMTLAGQVFGNITCGGILRLAPTARVTGNIRTRVLVIEEGAILNGECSMSRPGQRSKA